MSAVPPLTPVRDIATVNAERKGKVFARQEEIRALYNMLDRNRIQLSQFIERLNAMGVEVTPDAERVLSHFANGTGSLTFAQLLFNLGNTPNNLSTTPAGVRTSLEKTRTSPRMRLFQTPDPSATPESWSTPRPEEGEEEYHRVIPIIQEYCSRSISPSTFKDRLMEAGISITPQLENVISNTLSFRKLFLEIKNVISGSHLTSPLFSPRSTENVVAAGKAVPMRSDEDIITWGNIEIDTEKRVDLNPHSEKRHVLNKSLQMSTEQTVYDLPNTRRRATPCSDKFLRGHGDILSWTAVNDDLDTSMSSGKKQIPAPTTTPRRRDERMEYRFFS